MIVSKLKNQLVSYFQLKNSNKSRAKVQVILLISIHLTLSNIYTENVINSLKTNNLNAQSYLYGIPICNKILYLY
jgi:hypothetical protein